MTDNAWQTEEVPTDYEEKNVFVAVTERKNNV
jgi:hypothetical protein